MEDWKLILSDCVLVKVEHKSEVAECEQFNWIFAVVVPLVFVRNLKNLAEGALVLQWVSWFPSLCGELGSHCWNSSQEHCRLHDRGRFHLGKLYCWVVRCVMRNDGKFDAPLPLRWVATAVDLKNLLQLLVWVLNHTDDLRVLRCGVIDVDTWGVHEIWNIWRFWCKIRAFIGEDVSGHISVLCENLHKCFHDRGKIWSLQLYGKQIAHENDNYL